MASVRNFKKDLRYLFNELVTECYVYEKLNPEADEKKINGVIRDLLTHYNDYIARANQPNGKHNPKLVRQHFMNIRKDLIEKTFPIIEKLV